MTAAAVTPQAATQTTTTSSAQAATESTTQTTTQATADGQQQQSTQQQTTTQQQSATTTSDGTQQQAQQQTQEPTRVVPEQYTLTLQQGTILEASDVADVAAMAKEQQLTQAEAEAALVAYEQSLRDQSTKFRSELEADTTLGGANLAHTQRNVLRALDALAPSTTPEGAGLRKFLDKSGLGNSLHIVRLLDKVGRGMGEDRPILTSAPQGSSPVDMVELFYGKQS
jgi:hypothetical protein